MSANVAKNPGKRYHNVINSSDDNQRQSFQAITLADSADSPRIGCTTSDEFITIGNGNARRSNALLIPVQNQQ